MASGETAPPSKVPPKPSGAQEQIPATSSSAATAATAAASSAVVYPDWSGFQAYSPVPPHGFFPPVVSSPQTHPYMWGTQSMMPPYGTPPPPFVMYPHGGVYVHPSVSAGTHPFSPYAMPSPGGNPESFNAAPETDGKASEGKEGSSMKRPNGSLGKGTKEMGKPSGASANGAVSQSETGSEGSSGGSDADSQNDSLGKAADAGGSRNGGGKTTRGPQNGSAHPPSHGTLTQPLAIMPVMPAGASGPTTNLNIGMDYWGGPTIAPIRIKDHNAPGQSIPPELRLQDERELKRERRKQSNRESARRSRLRKQAECEDLTQRVESLQQENTSLTAEVSRVRKEYEELLSENNSLKERLEQISKGTEDSQQCRKEEGREGPLDSTAGACV